MRSHVQVMLVKGREREETGEYLRDERGEERDVRVC